MKVIKIYILILSFLVISTQVDQELLNCSYQPKDSCKNYAITPEKGVECCKITVVNLRALNTKYSTTTQCNIFSNKILSEIEVKEKELLYIEANALLYILYDKENDMLSYAPSTITINDCPSQNVTITESFLDVTDEEKNILFHENHCQMLYV